MSNATSLKYTNLYTINRYRNDFFEEWLKANFEIIEGKEVWNYGTETFISKTTGERIYSEAKIMQSYVKGKNPYFKDFSDMDAWLDSNYKTQVEFFAAR